MCSKDLRTGKECNNIPTTIGNEHLKKFFCYETSSMGYQFM